MSSIYKSKHFVEKKESVRIPDFVSISPPVEEPQEFPETDTADQEDAPPDAETVDIPVRVGDTDIFLENTYRPDTIRPRIIEEEKSRVRIISAEEMSAAYEQSLKQLASQVAQQAYFDAINKKKAELKDCIAQVQNLMDELVVAHRQFIEDYTAELKYMAIDIAEKMVLEKISEDEMILQRLVLQSMSSVKNAEWLNVEVSERLVGLVDFLRKELEKPEYNGRAFVIPIAGSDSFCRIITNEGAVVSTIETQANNLRKAFREFDQQ